MNVELRVKTLAKLARTLSCEGFYGPCGRTEGVEKEATRTAYYVAPCEHEDCAEVPEMKTACWASRHEEANSPSWLCRECAAAYHAHWDEMWNDYYAGIM